MLLLAKQTGDYRSVGWGGQIINHNYLQLIHFQAVQNKQPGPLEELTVSLQVACGSVGNELKPRGNKRRGRREVLHDWWRLLLLLFHLIGGVMTWKVAVLWCCWQRWCFCFVYHPTTPTRSPFHVPRWCSFWPALCEHPPSPFPRPIHSLPAGVFLPSFSALSRTLAPCLLIWLCSFQVFHSCV